MEELSGRMAAITEDVVVQFNTNGSLQIFRVDDPAESVTLPALAALRLLVLGERYKQALIDVIMDELEEHEGTDARPA